MTRFNQNKKTLPIKMSKPKIENNMNETGSIKRKFVAPALQAERDKLAFDQMELRAKLYGDPNIQTAIEGIIAKMEKHPELANTFEYRELSRMEQSMN